MPPKGYTKRRYRWTAEEVIAKLQEWNETYGEPPGANDWQPSDSLKQAQRSAERAQAWSQRVARFHDGEWPWVGTVAKHFGTWNNALRAAGLEVRWETTRRPAGANFEQDIGRLDSDDLRRLVDRVEEAMTTGSVGPMREALCQIANDALAWAQLLPPEN